MLIRKASVFLHATFHTQTVVFNCPRNRIKKQMKEKKKKSLIRSAISVAIMVIAVNFGQKLFNSKKELTLSNKNTIAERATIMNKDCPFTFDSNTRLDSVSSPEKNVLRQNYTLLNDSKSDIDTEAFQNIFKPEFKKI